MTAQGVQSTRIALCQLTAWHRKKKRKKGANVLVNPPDGDRDRVRFQQQPSSILAGRWKGGDGREGEGKGGMTWNDSGFSSSSSSSSFSPPAVRHSGSQNNRTQHMAVHREGVAFIAAVMYAIQTHYTRHMATAQVTTGRECVWIQTSQVRISSSPIPSCRGP